MSHHKRYLVFCLVLAFLPAYTLSQPVYLFREGFDTQPVGPLLPPGWDVSGSEWTVNQTTPAPESLPNSLMFTGRIAGWVAMPTIDLRNIRRAQLTYQVRRTSMFPANALRVVLSTDGGTTYDHILADYGQAAPSTDSKYVGYELSLPAAAFGHVVRIRFETTGGEHSLAKANLDDIAVMVPALSADVTTMSFQAEPGTSVTNTFSLNAYGRSATVTPRLKEGSRFSISPSAPVVIAAGSSTLYTVTFTPQEPGTTTDSLLVTSEARDTVMVLLRGSTPRSGRFGFEAESSQALEQSSGIEIALGASYDRSPGIQGFQFTVSWDSDLISQMEVQPGSVISDASRWQLNVEPGTRSVRVLLLGAGTTSLPSGDYPNLFRLRFGVGNVAAGQPPVRFILSNVITSLAVPTGDDAVLSTTPEIHDLTLLEAYSSFTVGSKNIQFSPVRSGAKRDSILTVTNPGTVPLTIDSVLSSNPLFRVNPSRATIGAGKSQPFTITFQPTFTAFGHQRSSLIFRHGTEDTVSVRAVGTGGRGDPCNDGIVDVMDLVEVVDFVLGRTSALPEERASADLYPFDKGDAVLDVRDLTVLAQAIARAKWPDEIRLPDELESPVGSSKNQGIASLSAVIRRDTLSFDAVIDADIRALQLVLKPDRSPGPVLNQLNEQGVAFISDYDAARGTARLVYYRTDSGSITSGRRAIASIICPGCSAVSLSYGVAVGTDGSRIAVRMDPVVGTPSDPKPELPEQFGAGPVYPSPLGPGQILRIPIELPVEDLVRLEMYDVLGRRVYRAEETLSAGQNTMEWGGNDSAGHPVAAGLYLLRLRTSGEVVNLRVVVVR